MFELAKTAEIDRLISIAKSNSGISGPRLAEAHMELGKALGKQMTMFAPENTTVVAMLRSGIFFAEGIYFSLGCRFQLFDPKHEAFIRPDTKNVILVDSVINTGKTMLDIMDSNMFVACSVVNEKAVPLFEDRLFTIRVSKNSFVGSKVQKQSGNLGPDTTMRLLNII